MLGLGSKLAIKKAPIIFLLAQETLLLLILAKTMILLLHLNISTFLCHLLHQGYIIIMVIR